MDALEKSLTRLPRIDAGYATPGSDYMSAVRQRQPTKPLTSSPDKTLRSHDDVTDVNRKFEYDDNGDDVTLLRWKSKGCGCSKEHDIFNKPKETTETDDRLKFARKSIFRELTIPTNNRKVSNVTAKSLSDVGRYYTISPLKLSSSNSASSKRRLSVKSIPDLPIDKSWNPPKIGEERYQEARKSLLKGGGKFRERMIKYFTKILRGGTRCRIATTTDMIRI
ncbi:hypothetical protein DPMN_095256 [Dreissena polymorpha]|uniref:Uncharacterized protein n=1 Tax=Dreissena polymorpha TaxID=45954 RepID=A0A9D4L7K4_DREPO|nr:hypothetical protein DPMN_095256 [Dreissena polymorpha]